MDCLQLPFIRVEEAVSWTQRAFPKRKFCPEIEVYLWQTFLKANVRKNYTFQVNRKKKWYRKTTSYLEQPSRYFCQHFMRRTTQQTLLAINLASQQKLTKLYFSAQWRTQFKLLTVPFNPLRCGLRSDRLVYMNSHVWKFCKDLFLNFRVIWPINQIDFLIVSSLILLRSLRVYTIKQLFFSILIIVALGIFNSPLHASVINNHHSPRFQR